MTGQDEKREDEARDRWAAGDDEAGDVESAGETTAAATGSAERAAAGGGSLNDDTTAHASPVGADTMVKVAGMPDADKE